MIIDTFHDYRMELVEHSTSESPFYPLKLALQKNKPIKVSSAQLCNKLASTENNYATFSLKANIIEMCGEVTVRQLNQIKLPYTLSYGLLFGNSKLATNLVEFANRKF